MNLTGNTKLFINERVNKEGVKFRNYSISISSKDKVEEGHEQTYSHLSLKALFVNEEIKSKLEALNPSKCYDMEITEGFLTIETYKNTDGSIQKGLRVAIKNATLLAEKDYTKVESKPTKKPAKKNNELPF